MRPAELPRNDCRSPALILSPHQNMIMLVVECEPALAISCEDDTTCQPGTEGYTCGENNTRSIGNDKSVLKPVKHNMQRAILSN